MTDQSPIVLGDEDGAIAFKADGTYKLFLGRKATEPKSPEHLLLMMALFSALKADDEIKQAVMACVDQLTGESEAGKALVN
jgi:hypothetical protein